MAETQPDLWIFAYGSLMWRPDFAFAESRRAHLAGYRRSLCILSHVYRGTTERPGLVFGLDQGGDCVGVAFRIAPADRAKTLEAVRLRELITSVYREADACVLLDDGRAVNAITYVADHTHDQYAGSLAIDDAIRIVRDASGISGSNADYVLNTQVHLRDLGVEDGDLDRLCAALGSSSPTSVRQAPGKG